MINSIRTLPPGSITIFAVEVDEFGNEVYVGGPVTYGGVSAVSDGADGGTAGGDIPPSYASPPAPKKTTPSSTWDNPPGARVLDQYVVDGISIGEVDRLSLEATPSSISGTDWQNPDSVRVSDNNNAFIDAPAGDYCNELELSGFDMSEIPPNATIIGIKVTVERSKI